MLGIQSVQYPGPVGSSSWTRILDTGFKKRCCVLLSTADYQTILPCYWDVCSAVLVMLHCSSIVTIFTYIGVTMLHCSSIVTIFTYICVTC